jgi:hypothetical protein
MVLYSKPPFHGPAQMHKTPAEVYLRLGVGPLLSLFQIFITLTLMTVFSLGDGATVDVNFLFRSLNFSAI